MFKKDKVYTKCVPIISQMFCRGILGVVGVVEGSVAFYWLISTCGAVAGWSGVGAGAGAGAGARG